MSEPTTILAKTYLGRIRQTTPTHSRGRNVALTAVLLSALLLAGCRAPGMKFDTQARPQDTRTIVNGQEITLRALTPATLQAFAARPAAAGLADLMVAKPRPYQIGPLDTLMVTVWDHPELTLPLGQFRTDSATGLVVDEDGMLYFPYIGRVKVGGLTVVEARTLITSRLDKVLQRPQVDIKVLAYRSQKVLISGEVRTPAVYTVTDVPFTLAEAINRAGGFLPTADQSRLEVSRGDQTWSIDLPDLLARGNKVSQILLKDGDSLNVRHRDETPVYLMGELRNPRSVPTYHGRISLAQALSEAGGINTASADARSIYVFRRGKADNAVEVFHLDAYNPAAMVLADRFPLQPRDVVYVDSGTLGRWNRVVSLMVPTVSAITSAAEIKYFTK